MLRTGPFGQDCCGTDAHWFVMDPAGRAYILGVLERPDGSFLAGALGKGPLNSKY